MNDRDAHIETSLDRRQGPQWHLWIVGLFFVLLNAAGAYDYVMTLGQDADYFQSQDYDDTQIAYFEDYPILPAVFWTIGVWGALAASILLLLRSRWATPVAVIALVSQLCLDLVTFGFIDRWQIFGPQRSLFDGAILLLTAVLSLYCRAMSARGVLR
jgi:hypothetical protein